jgi:hypothetical protein
MFKGKDYVVQHVVKGVDMLSSICIHFLFIVQGRPMTKYEQM